MKYFKRLKIYKANNVTFNPETLDAHSYKWWKFVSKVEGKVIFNNHYYSPSTRKHQNKVETVLRDLGIKVDQYLPLPKGINSSSLQELYTQAEEYLCDKILEDILKQQERSYKARVRRQTKKLEEYLENQVHFRDYEIKQGRQFGHINTVAVHQVVDMKSMEQDVNNALHSFHRDGFGRVVFYVGSAS